MLAECCAVLTRAPVAAGKTEIECDRCGALLVRGPDGWGFTVPPLEEDRPAPPVRIDPATYTGRFDPYSVGDKVRRVEITAAAEMEDGEEDEPAPMRKAGRPKGAKNSKPTQAHTPAPEPVEPASTRPEPVVAPVAAASAVPKPPRPLTPAQKREATRKRLASAKRNKPALTWATCPGAPGVDCRRRVPATEGKPPSMCPRCRKVASVAPGEVYPMFPAGSVG
jgi:hypothetical protein